MADSHDPESSTGESTAPFVPAFDTDSNPAQPDPLQPLAAEAEPTAWSAMETSTDTGPERAKHAKDDEDDEDGDAEETTGEEDEAEDSAAISQPLPAPTRSVVVPSTYQYLKRWVFALIVAAVWVVAAGIGLGLYYWWFHSLDKTPAVFVVLVYVVVCTVGSLLTAMAENRPKIAALSIGLMSAPLASVAAAAVLYGMNYCEHASRCLVGVLPY